MITRLKPGDANLRTRIPMPLFWLKHSSASVSHRPWAVVLASLFRPPLRLASVSGHNTVRPRESFRPVTKVSRVRTR